jgi:hypothetical protein
VSLQTPATIGGVAIEDILALDGAPVYVYDSAIIKRQVDRLRSAFAGFEHRIMYACKALSNIAVLRLMKQFGVGLDTVSIQEVELGLHAGFTPDEILFTPNMVSFEELKIRFRCLSSLDMSLVDVFRCACASTRISWRVATSASVRAILIRSSASRFTRCVTCSALLQRMEFT